MPNKLTAVYGDVNADTLCQIAFLGANVLSLKRHLQVIFALIVLHTRSVGSVILGKSLDH